MNAIDKAFNEHPATVGETYGEHFVQAMSFSGKMFRASIACFIHGLVPCLFERTGGNAIEDLYDRMIRNRAAQTPMRRAAQAAGEATAPEGS